MKTLAEALKQKRHIDEINMGRSGQLPTVHIVRDVRYWADYGGVRYALENDWTTEDLEQKLAKLDKES